jgi:hypothetical protein
MYEISNEHEHGTLPGYAYRTKLILRNVFASWARHPQTPKKHFAPYWTIPSVILCQNHKIKRFLLRSPGCHWKNQGSFYSCQILDDSKKAGLFFPGGLPPGPCKKIGLEGCLLTSRPMDSESAEFLRKILQRFSEKLRKTRRDVLMLRNYQVICISSHISYMGLGPCEIYVFCMDVCMNI